jgi:hypothetical protein
MVQAHPVLFASISNSRTDDPQFTWLPSLSPKDLMSELRPSKEGTSWEGELDPVLESAFALGLYWKEGGEVEGRPLWKVRYGRVKEETQEKLVVIFVGHHALFDGRSGWNVARTLFESLSTPASSPGLSTNPTQLILPSPPPPFDPTIESLVSVAPLKSTLLSEIYTSILLPKLPSFIRSYLPSPPPLPWTGKSTPLHPKIRKQKSLLLAPSMLSKLLIICRQEKTSLTSFLHAAITFALIPLSGGLDISDTIPLDARSLLPPSSTCMNCTGAITSTYSASPSPSSAGDSDRALTCSLWDEARRHTALLRAPSALADSVRIWGMLSYIPSSSSSSSFSSASSNPPPATAWETYFLPKLTQPRNGSFEISNMGVLPFSPSPSPPPFPISAQDEGGLKLEQVVFTQPHQEMGPALVFSLASMPALGLTISVSWKEGVVSQEEVDAVLRSIESSIEDC